MRTCKARAPRGVLMDDELGGLDVLATCELQAGHGCPHLHTNPVTGAVIRWPQDPAAVRTGPGSFEDLKARQRGK